MTALKWFSEEIHFCFQSMSSSIWSSVIYIYRTFTVFIKNGSLQENSWKCTTLFLSRRTSSSSIMITFFSLNHKNVEYSTEKALNDLSSLMTVWSCSHGSNFLNNSQNQNHWSARWLCELFIASTAADFYIRILTSTAKSSQSPIFSFSESPRDSSLPARLSWHFLLHTTFDSAATEFSKFFFFCATVHVRVPW